MAKQITKKQEGTRAKISSRTKTTEETVERRFSTRPEDVVKTLSDDRILARTPEGRLYLTSKFYLHNLCADPNRYGRPASLVSPEEAALLH